MAERALGLLFSETASVPPLVSAPRVSAGRPGRHGDSSCSKSRPANWLRLTTAPSPGQFARCSQMRPVVPALFRSSSWPHAPARFGSRWPLLTRLMACQISMPPGTARYAQHSGKLFGRILPLQQAGHGERIPDGFVPAYFRKSTPARVRSGFPGRAPRRNQPAIDFSTSRLQMQFGCLHAGLHCAAIRWRS